MLDACTVKLADLPARSHRFAIILLKVGPASKTNIATTAYAQYVVVAIGHSPSVSIGFMSANERTGRLFADTWQVCLSVCPFVAMVHCGQTVRDRQMVAMEHLWEIDIWLSESAKKFDLGCP